MNNYFHRTSLATLILICLIAVLSDSCTTRCQPYYTGRGCAPVNQNFDVTTPIIGTVDPNYSSFNVPAQTVIYSSVPLVIQSGYGTLVGDTLTVQLSATSGGLPVSITYTGRKE